MKKLILIMALAMLSTGSHAYIKCERSAGGGTCCWDTVRDGPFRPIGC